jgi:malonyl-CoA O-methyltransferase
MWLHHVEDPAAQLARWHEALPVGGLLLFSTLGPGTLLPLQGIYREAGWGAPMAPLVDMHDLGDMLVACGFADPVMDQETICLTWRKAPEALAELRSLGSNADPSRMQGLRTRRWQTQLTHRLQQASPAGSGLGVSLPFELVYGHAIKQAPALPVASETRFGVDVLQQALRTGPRTPRP